MASLARPLLRTAARPQTFVSPLRQAARRSYSSAAPAKSNKGLYLGVAAATAGGVGYYLYTQGQLGPLNDKSARPTLFKPTKEDYQKVYDDVAEILEDNDYDDGSYGPVSFLVLIPSYPC
jgi:cytochrome c peroxidase